MASSIILLLLLQFLWLTKAYDDARERFQKETSALFRNTIFTLHDSLIVRNIEPLHSDSLPGGNRLLINRSPKGFDNKDFGDDSLRIKRREAFVEVFVSSDNKDSIRRMLRPLTAKMRLDRSSRKYLVRMGPDSLKRDSIAFHFSRALSNSGISIRFNIHFIRTTSSKPHPLAQARGTLVSDVVPFTPLSHYAVSFPNSNHFFLSSIAPQIMFCAFLTILTAGSFYIMYTNIRAQKKLMEIKNDFISNVTHELKTPVSTVSVALEAMARFNGLDDPKKSGEYLSMARCELKRLVFMTDKILQSASFEKTTPEMEFTVVDVQLQIQEVMESMRLIFGQRNVQVRFESKGNNFLLRCSRAHLLTVLYNLFDNAVKYSPRSSTIAVALEAHEKHILLSVKDDGIGIPAIYHRKIFEKFFRVPSGDVHNTKGYGLGLSYISRVIETHGGKISVESEPGQGSCFTITLPRNRVR